MKLREEEKRTFDLAQAPLWRAVWVRINEREQVLALIFHPSTA